MKIKFGILFLLLMFFTKSFASDYSTADCPVIGNTETSIYHVPGGKHYGKMLRKNKGKDNRKCFKTEDEAKNSGYRKSKT